MSVISDIEKINLIKNIAKNLKLREVVYYVT